MNNKELYCFCLELCGRVEKEKASICGRGFLSGAWRRSDVEPITYIITLHTKARNDFILECRV
jgi:hypothetical protein